MASVSTVCEVCGKPARLTSTGNNMTSEQLQEGPQVHQPGSEGDSGCYDKWWAQETERRQDEAEAQLDAARALVASADEAEKATGRRNTTAVARTDKD